jgi:hypothetical protein
MKMKLKIPMPALRHRIAIISVALVVCTPSLVLAWLEEPHWVRPLMFISFGGMLWCLAIEIMHAYGLYDFKRALTALRERHEAQEVAIGHHIAATIAADLKKHGHDFDVQVEKKDPPAKLH